LKNAVKNLNLKSTLRLYFYAYSNPKSLIDDIRNNKFTDNNTLAFIDYYLGDGINGNHTIKLLLEFNKKTKILLLSQSQHVISTYNNKPKKSRSINLIPKDNYTFTTCSLFLEQFIESCGQLTI